MIVSFAQELLSDDHFPIRMHLLSNLDSPRPANWLEGLDRGPSLVRNLAFNVLGLVTDNLPLARPWLIA